MLDFNYTQLVDYLNKKYGKVPGSYFCRENFKSINQKIKRGKDGLSIHHVKEIEIPLLSQKHNAEKYSFSYQKSENLVYCDYIEHTLLHVLIYENHKNKAKSDDFDGFFIMQSLFLSDYYRGYDFKRINYIQQANTLNDNIELFESLFERVNHKDIIDNCKIDYAARVRQILAKNNANRQ